MSLPKLDIDNFYTEQVATVDHGDDVDTARSLMERHGVRHLPVTNEGKCVGVLSMRDVHAALAVKGSNAKNMQVKDICSDDTYVTHPGSPLAAVASEMAEKKYGSSVVVDSHGKVLGIFTTTDAVRALSQVLSGHMSDE